MNTISKQALIGISAACLLSASAYAAPAQTIPQQTQPKTTITVVPAPAAPTLSNAQINTMISTAYAIAAGDPKGYTAAQGVFAGAAGTPITPPLLTPTLYDCEIKCEATQVLLCINGDKGKCVLADTTDPIKNCKEENKAQLCTRIKTRAAQEFSTCKLPVTVTKLDKTTWSLAGCP